MLAYAEYEVAYAMSDMRLIRRRADGLRIDGAKICMIKGRHCNQNERRGVT